MPSTNSFQAPDAGGSSSPGEPSGGDLGSLQIGPYRLLRSLGEGGVGAVWLAEQSVPVERQVAIKLIKLGMDSRDVILRFASERQLLARVTHPNIARVFDAGTTEQGRPYLVMEYVPGLPITEHVARRTLDLRQRVRLFQKVCAAVQHAHAKGIIHRDLKPSNVLVYEEAGEAIVKVIDFGLAKVMPEYYGKVSLRTNPGQVLGTLEYMSPEQLR